VFPAAIYTTKRAKADWRKLQFDGRIVKFKDEKLPQIIADRCAALLKKMGMRYGAFDLIEREDGSFVFLEVNLIGAYHWLVDKLELAIPEAIAEELIAIKNVVAQAPVSDNDFAQGLISSLVGAPI